MWWRWERPGTPAPPAGRPSEAFTNDLDEAPGGDRRHVGTNQAKADHDPAQWPPRSEDWCRYADAWVTVKVKWDLSADQREVDALWDMLASC